MLAGCFELEPAPQSDQRKAQVREHIRKVRNAEDRLLIGELVIVNGLRNRTVNQRGRTKERGD